DARTSLAASDVAGVALLGIKALAEQVERGGAVVQSTQEELEALRRENAVLRERAAALEQENRELRQKDQVLEQRLMALEQLVRELMGRTAEAQEPWLGDNIPNPHDGTTTIPYRVPVGVSSAVLVVRDMSGRQLLEVVLPARGQVGQVTLAIGSYPSGVYEYALVLDGRVVASKQMHLVR
ncbi:MAG: hypothetical protein RMJ47_08265, partial [Bacteroidota bacterium]|nr:hypothetical protein [Bacteroidota bacterium]